VRRKAGPLSVKNHRLKNFFKRHNRVISLLGGLIVFVTFVVKDGFAEKWKDDAGALNMAQYIYSVKADSAATSAAVMQAVLFSQMSDGNIKDPERWFEDLKHLTQEKEQSMLDQEIALSNAEILIDRLPKVRQERDELDRLRKLARQYGNEALDAYLDVDRTARSIRVMPPDKKLEQAEKYRDDHDTREWSKKTGKLVDDVWALLKGTLEQANILRKSNETKSQCAWWIAAVLYTLGWGLAVVGRFYDIPVTSE
jgi:hypothetical protein